MSQLVQQVYDLAAGQEGSKGQISLSPTDADTVVKMAKAAKVKLTKKDMEVTGGGSSRIQSEKLCEIVHKFRSNEYHIEDESLVEDLPEGDEG
jgi:hypothetical protein